MRIADVEVLNTLLLAPMAGVSDYPFRVLCREYGCRLAYTEMISAEAFVRESKKTMRYLYRGPEEYGDGNLLGVQICGANPESMAEAASMIQDMGADILDINMGCPVRKVTKIVAGSALLADLPLLEKIVRSVKKRLRIPLTAKIRTGFGNTVNALEVSKVLEDSGVDAMSIHGRTQKQAYQGFADWNIIRDVKRARRIPVIGNGDVVSFEQYVSRKEESSCDAVMVGRGTMGTPWVFRPHYTPSLAERKQLILKHYRLALHFYGEYLGVLEMRKHLAWYIKGLPGSSAFRTLVYALQKPEEIVDRVHEFFDCVECSAGVLKA